MEESDTDRLLFRLKSFHLVQHEDRLRRLRFLGRCGVGN